MMKRFGGNSPPSFHQGPFKLFNLTRETYVKSSNQTQDPLLRKQRLCPLWRFRAVACGLDHGTSIVAFLTNGMKILRGFRPTVWKDCDLGHAKHP